GFSHDPDEFLKRLQPDLAQEPHQAYLPLVILGGFLLGIVIGRFSHRLLEGPAGMPAWFPGIQAWVSLGAVILLLADTLIHLVIYPSLLEERRITLPNWQYVLSAIVAFYFGVRS